MSKAKDDLLDDLFAWWCEHGETIKDLTWPVSIVGVGVAVLVKLFR